MSSRWQDVFNHLIGAGYEVYSPAQKIGECESPYVVIRSAGVYEAGGDISSTRALYDIMLYIPFGKYSTIEPAMTALKESMKGLFPMIRPTYSETPPYPDDLVKGFMISVQYENYRKM